jgi:hypothetical protein
VTAGGCVPTSEDRFSFGIWTVGWQGVDLSGGATRPPMPVEHAARTLLARAGVSVRKLPPAANERVVGDQWA